MRLPRVFRPISRLVGALQGLKAALKDLRVAVYDLSVLQKNAGPAVTRLEVLEMSRHQFEALCEGLLLKAEGKLRAANNAEARERQMKKSYEHLIDPLAEDGDETQAAARHPDIDNDAPTGEEERVQALRLDVAPSPKELAQRAKFGVK